MSGDDDSSNVDDNIGLVKMRHSHEKKISELFTAKKTFPKQTD